MMSYPKLVRPGLFRRVDDSSVVCECGQVRVSGLFRYGVQIPGSPMALPNIRWDTACYCGIACRDEWEAERPAARAER